MQGQGRNHLNDFSMPNLLLELSNTDVQMDKPTCRKPRFYNIEKERELVCMYMYVHIC